MRSSACNSHDQFHLAKITPLFNPRSFKRNLIEKFHQDKETTTNFLLMLLYAGIF
jgi:hypothetical protein